MIAPETLSSFLLLQLKGQVPVENIHNPWLVNGRDSLVYLMGSLVME